MQRLTRMRRPSQRLVRPLNISVKQYSEVMGFSIAPVLATYGTLVGVRVQDLETFEWFEWDYGVWVTRMPEVHVGPGKLYIAAYAINEGDGGLMQLSIKDDVNEVLAFKEEVVAAGATFGDETDPINMPNRNYGIVITVVP